MIPLLAVTVSCGGSGGGNSDPAPAAVQTLPSPAALPDDQDIMAKAYDVNYSVPEGFYVDPLTETESRSYTVHHVLDESGSYEMCSDDMVEAQAWEAADNASRAVSGELVTILENDRYFEFVRELSYEQDVGNIDDMTSPGYARVFKCAHTNRTGVERNEVDGFSGIRNAQPVNARDLRDFTEYLWQFRFFTAKRAVVIDSYAGSDRENPLHTLLLALVVSQGTGKCDRIDVVEWQFSADQMSGEVSRRYDIRRSFEAELANGVARLCS